MSAKVVSLNVVNSEIPDVGGSVGFTSIDKRPVVGSRQVTPAGVAGDKRSDLKHHGSPMQAVYAYAKEDYAWWQEQLGFELTPGQFGENLTTENIDLANLVIGTKIKIGNTQLRATAPRIPCGTFARWMNIDQWVKKFTEGERVGSYFEVLTAGEVAAGDEIEIISTPEHDVSVLDYFLVHTGDRDHVRVKKCANCPDILPEVREKFSKFIN